MRHFWRVVCRGVFLGLSKVGQRRRVGFRAGTTPSSARWLARQRRDIWVHARERDGRRSRASYKLEQILDKYPSLMPARGRVADLGAAPGGWSQVFAERLGKRGQVIALDTAPIAPIEGVAIMRGDIHDAEAQAEVLALAGGGGLDLVASDIAPPATGAKAVDRLRLEALGEAALDFALATLVVGGGLIIKARRGASGVLARRMGLVFRRCAEMKPPASREGSAECYLVATGLLAGRPREGVAARQDGVAAQQDT